MDVLPEEHGLHTQHAGNAHMYDKTVCGAVFWVHAAGSVPGQSAA